jgi:hypothetical protein
MSYDPANTQEALTGEVTAMKKTAIGLPLWDRFSPPASCGSVGRR